MKTQRSNHPFCARCGKTAFLHAFSEASCAKYIAPDPKEAKALEATKVETAKIDSGVIDNRLLCLTNEWLEAKIRMATLHLQVGFAMPRGSAQADEQFEAALRTLGGLGAS